MTCRDWGDLRAPEFAALDPMRDIAVLPLAATEQHGPHLPTGTDSLIMAGMLERLRADCPADLSLILLPVQQVGKSNEHSWAPGTLTLTAETALRAWVEIGLAVARAGVRKVILVNSHGGNLDLMSILSRELRVRAGMLAVRCQWGSFGVPEGAYSPRELAFGIHGGDYETSLMLHFRPGLVDRAACGDLPSRAEGAAIPPVGGIAFGWIASDLNPAGAVGEAHLATPEKGAATAAHQVAGFIALARQVAGHGLEGFAPVPGQGGAFP
ncbi:MAG: creatininase family protein [Paracoccaceae bacterium]|nr:MAG: creatininase family protein [Paracoccaceae bacterium]